jgi:hypothetical protein
LTSIDPPHAPLMARPVLEFFLRNPLVTDTGQCIADLRIRQEFACFTLDQVKEALLWLTGENYLKCDEPESSPPFYGLNTERAGDAKRLLSGGSTEPTHDAGQLLACSLAWLDQLLIRYLSALPADEDGTPAWLSAALASLKRRIAGRDDESARPASDVDAALEQALRRAPANEPLAAL